MLAANYVFVLAIAFIAATSLYYGSRIKTPRVAMQWSLNGKPTWYAPKIIALWATIAFALNVRLLIWLAMSYAPDKVHGVELGLTVFSIVVAVAHLWVLRVAAHAA